MSNHQPLLDCANKLALGIFKETAPAIDEGRENPAPCVHAALHGGLRGVATPVVYGGDDASLSDICQIVESLGGGCPSSALALVMHWTSLLYLQRWAITPQDEAEGAHLKNLQQTIFRAVMDDGAFVANCYGEPGSGANISKPFTLAKKEGGHWVVNGVKFGSAASISDFIQFHASAENADGSSQIVQFIAPTKTPGVVIDDYPDILGVKGAAPQRVTLSDVTIDDAWRMGPPDMFFEAGRRFPYASLLLSAPYVGLVAEALNTVRNHGAERRIQGLEDNLSSLPQFRAGLAQQFVHLEAMRALLYRAANRADKGEADAEAFALMEAAKVFVAEGATDITTQCLRLCGGRALMNVLPLERYVRDSHAAALHPPSISEALDNIANALIDPVEFSARKAVPAKELRDTGVIDQIKPK